MNSQKVGDISNSDVKNLNINESVVNTGKDINGWHKPFCGMVIVNIAIAICNIVVLAVCCPRTTNLGFDYIGIIVTIFSIVVMILIGWNIYSVLDVKQIKKEYSTLVLSHQNVLETISKHDRKRELGYQELQAKLFFITAELLNSTYGRHLQSFEYYIHALWHYILAEESKYIDITLNKMQDVCPKIDKEEFFEDEGTFNSAIIRIKESGKLSASQLDKFVDLILRCHSRRKI